MKLKQTHRHNTIPSGSGAGAFDTRLVRHGASFGILIGAGQARGLNLDWGADEDPGQDHAPWKYQAPVLPGLASSVFNTVTGTVKYILDGVGNQVRRYREVSADRVALRNLLVQSDHYLRDIGLERYQLEALQSNGGSLDELVRGRNKTGTRRLRLVPNARIGDGQVHMLDRAA